ncbi:MAG: cation diffusion facilitator family transporter [Actinomycetota bacterium]|nr:cation diffusion facilitator family transporter [Actinomycetota bacterium]
MDKGHEDSTGRGHDHTAMLAANERALKISVWLTGIYFLIEVALGVASGSVAVISDALHTFSAVGGVLLALIAGRIAARPATRHRTFGSIRAEIVVAMLNGFFLVAMAGVVIFMGFRRLLNPADLNPTLMLIAATGGIITEVIALRVLYSGQKDNLNVRGAYWHVVQTFVGSLLIIVAAIVVTLTDFVAIDPILGIAFGFVLFWAAWGITRDSLRVLMETVPTDVDLPPIIAELTSIDGVENAHHVHAWALTTGRNLFSAHLLITEDADCRLTLERAQSIVRNDFGFFFSTIQIETECEEYDAAAAIDFANTDQLDNGSEAN